MVYDVVPGQIRLILDMVVWPDFPVIEYTPYFENVSQTDSGILSDIAVLDYEAEDPVVFGEQKVKRDCFFGNSRITVRYHLGAKAATFSFSMCQSDFACCLPYEEECVQLENRYLDDWLPLHGTLNWGEEDPCHAMCGMGGGYGSKIWQFNGREPKPDHDFARHRKLLEWGKELRDLHMIGDVYPLTEAPERDFSQWNGQQVHDPATECGMVQIFRRKRSTNSEFRLDLRGLEPDARYEAEFFTGEKRTLSGRKLAGLTVSLPEPRSFQLIRYRRAE